MPRNRAELEGDAINRGGPRLPHGRLAWMATTAVLIATNLISVSGQNNQDGESYASIEDADAVGRLLRAIELNLDAVPGELIVKFHPGITLRGQASVLSRLSPGLDMLQSEQIGDAQLVRFASRDDPANLAAAVAAQPEVEWAQPNYIRQLHTVPNDRQFQNQWNFEQISVPDAWDISDGGSASVTVAVIDTGITTTNGAFFLQNGAQVLQFPYRRNPDIAPARVQGSRDFTDLIIRGPNGTRRVVDMDGHGSHVAGTILQETNNGLGAAGVAYRAQLMSLKVCIGPWEVEILRFLVGAGNTEGFVSGCTDGDVAAAVRYAANNGAQVINLSLGFPAPTPVIRNAIAWAVSRGAFVAISAGNDAQDGNRVNYPAAYGQAFEGAMTVGATNRAGTRAAYSNTGSGVEIAAPGGFMAQSDLNGILQFTLCSPIPFPPRLDRYCPEYFEGTSMAAPHVAGVAALLYAQGITNPAAVEAAIKQFARDIGPPGVDRRFGWGLLDARRGGVGERPDDEEGNEVRNRDDRRGSDLRCRQRIRTVRASGSRIRDLGFDLAVSRRHLRSHRRYESDARDRGRRCR